MKTNKLIYTLSLFLLIGSLSLTSCKKKKAFKEEDGQTSADNRSAQGELDGGVSDANSAIQADVALNGRMAGSDELQRAMSGPCGTTYSVDTTGKYMGSVTLVYSGVSCYNRTRTGKIKLTILNYVNNVRWKNANAQLQIDYIGYKVTRTSDGKSVELNGTAIVTNVSGGTWFDLFWGTQPSLVHTVSAPGLQVTFDGSATATYNINRKFTYTYSGGVFTATGEGTGSDSSLNNLENFGTTRNGDHFTSQVTNPFVWNTTCGPQAPIQGEVNIKVDSKSFSLKCTFGVDNSGTVMSVSPGNCAWGMKAEWSYKKKTKTKLFGYY
jgi:hypothetical protein